MLNDLVVQSDERALLWKSLRKRAKKNQFYETELPDDITPALLLALLGIKNLQADYVTKENE